MRLRELLQKIRLRPPKEAEGERLVDAEERAWVEYMPSQQEDRPPH